MKIKWTEKGRSKEYGSLSVPIPDDLELDKSWDGRHAIPVAFIRDGRLHVSVKRDLKKEVKHGRGTEG